LSKQCRLIILLLLNFLLFASFFFVRVLKVVHQIIHPMSPRSILVHFGHERLNKIVPYFVQSLPKQVIVDRYFLNQIDCASLDTLNLIGIYAVDTGVEQLGLVMFDTGHFLLPLLLCL
jgi:hypothetical protein